MEVSDETSEMPASASDKTSTAPLDDSPMTNSLDKELFDIIKFGRRAHQRQKLSSGDSRVHFLNDLDNMSFIQDKADSMAAINGELELDRLFSLIVSGLSLICCLNIKVNLQNVYNMTSKRRSAMNPSRRLGMFHFQSTDPSTYSGVQLEAPGPVATEPTVDSLTTATGEELDGLSLSSHQWNFDALASAASALWNEAFIGENEWTDLFDGENENWDQEQNSIVEKQLKTEIINVITRILTSSEVWMPTLYDASEEELGREAIRFKEKYLVVRKSATTKKGSRSSNVKSKKKRKDDFTTDNLQFIYISSRN